MSMNTYPLVASAVLYLTENDFPYVILKQDTENGTVPQCVQALLDTNEFDNAICGRLTLDEFKQLHPEYNYLEELIPDYYYDAAEAYDFLTDNDTCCAFVGETSAEINTAFPNGVDNPIEETVDSEEILYLTPERQMSYFSQAYENIEELMNEYAKRMSGILPENFDYRSHICNIEGTYWC